MANDLLSAGYSVTSTICSNKWKNLIRSYRTSKDLKNKSGACSPRFHFFNMIDEILGTKPSNLGCTTLESSGLNMSPLTTDVIDLEEDNNSNENQAPSRKKNRTGKEVLKQKRHEEKMKLSKEKLELEKRKVQLLEAYLKSKNIDVPVFNTDELNSEN